jgi:hypothetical protein
MTGVFFRKSTPGSTVQNKIYEQNTIQVDYFTFNYYLPQTTETETWKGSKIIWGNKIQTLSGKWYIWKCKGFIIFFCTELHEIYLRRENLLLRKKGKLKLFLFYFTTSFNTSGYVNENVISEWRTGKDLERSNHVPILMYYPDICL